MIPPLYWSQQERANWARFENLAERYRDDPELRARIDSGDTAREVDELGIDPPPGVEFRIVANSPEVHHLALPSDPNTALGDETLNRAVGGSSLGTAASVGSVGTFGCSTAPSSLSSVGTVGTAGSAA